ncbi:ABC transporter ATP-binding protein [Candidatus Berkiella aquae]|uniref:ATP-binding cassette domain-containing protein n=1 Tax=Candidatus Berkiella aquae TaxID=295108 RepID=A0A0Q9YV59_9GAMM|nr:ATP-binding cassette domain-containing protein [Candidatus Berkiella aquae]MCS5712172.1 ATP-binding cassette domain-containing protein [Candidatus Berkiella aquae]
MIILNNIHVHFHHGTPLAKHVLRGIHLKINQGEFITIIGGNGAGKSTLMNVLAGEAFPSQGDIYFNQQNITRWSACKRSCKIARLFQDPMQGTFAHLTIEENLSLAVKRGKQRGLQRHINPQLRQNFKSLLAPLKLQLEKRLHHKVGTLSGGQRQALSLIMATLQQTELLLLDEHTAALDPKTAQNIMLLSQQIIQERQMTALMITHSLSQALHFGDRTLVLSEGNIVEDLYGSRRAQMQPEVLMKYFV